MAETSERAGRISFAAGLQPLVVESVEHSSSGVFRTCALIAATPHTAVNRKLVTDRCKSHIIPRPRSCLAFGTHPTAAVTAQWPDADPQPQPSTSAVWHTAAAAAAEGRAPLPSREQGLAVHSRPTPALDPHVLHFEGWWQRQSAEGSTQRCMVHISYHTDTSPAAFFVRGQLQPHHSSSASSSGSCSSSNCGGSSYAGSSKGRSVRSTHTSSSGSNNCSSNGSCESTAPSSNGDFAGGCSRHVDKQLLPPQGAWLCVTGASGEPLDQWDLHVGAQLDLLGRRVVLKKASATTMAWIDGWAKLLLQQKHALEQQLSKFAPIIPDQGLVKRSPERSDWSSPGLAAPAPTGGAVNLRHLRETIALLAARLRQHTAAVRLPRQLQELTPQGPTNWCLDDLLSVLCAEPFTPSAKHSSSGQLLRREFSRHGRRLPSLGHSPAGDPPPPSLNSLMNWLHSIPLAASAASVAQRPSALLELP